MIDIHSHILFSLDDGAKTLLETDFMVDLAYKEEIRTIIATPHYHEIFQYGVKKLEEVFSIVSKRYLAIKPDLKFYLGNECYLNENLLGALLEGKCKTLAGSRYVLIEISYYAPTKIIKAMLGDILVKGYIPIIAHCERLINNKHDLLKIYELKELGCFLQINADILLKPRKRWLKKWLFTNLKNGTISFIASDAHGISQRPPSLRKAFMLVKRHLGAGLAEDLFYNNPQNILDDVNK